MFIFEDKTWNLHKIEHILVNLVFKYAIIFYLVVLAVIVGYII